MHRASNGRLFERRLQVRQSKCPSCGLLANIYLVTVLFFPPKRSVYYKNSCKPAPVPALAELCHCLVAGRGQKPRHRALYRRALEANKYIVKTQSYDNVRRQAKSDSIAVSRPQGKSSAQRSQPSRDVQVIEPQLPSRSSQSDVHRHTREGQNIINV